VKLQIIVAAIAVVAIPLSVQGAEGQTAPKEKRYCEVNQQIGTRLGAVRTCRTKAERDAARAESRATAERIQSQKNFTEAMAGMGGGGVCRAAGRSC
jgi:hypothetical protein